MNLIFSQMNNLGQWIHNNGSIADARNIGGIVPAYPIFMFLGIIAVIVASIIKMKMKNIPLRELEWAILIVVPIGIIGGTIFGKAFIPGLTWYHIFFFWEPGMSLFGALALGTTAGFVWFYKRSKTTMISVWVYADCILPNVLLGQIIGRWGNMYNHEILGNVVSYESLSWLIPGIRDKLFYFPSELSTLDLPAGWDQLLHDNTHLWDGQGNFIGSLSDTISALTLRGGPHDIVPDSDQVQKLIDILHGGIQYREPLFLYESLANLGLWLILTFVIPNLSRWIQPKGKYPWDIQPNAYPGWFNKKYKTLPSSEIYGIKTQNPIKYKQVQVETPDGEKIELRMSLWSAWNKAYYLYEPENKNMQEFIARQSIRLETEEKLFDRLEQIKLVYENNLYRIGNDFKNKSSRFVKNSPKYKDLLIIKNNDIKVEKESYKTKKKEITDQLGGWMRYFKPNPDARAIEKLNNPNGYFIIRSGVLTGAYIFGYMLIRIILETHREARELFVQNYVVADFIVLALIILAGLGIIFIAQFISPYKWREVGWLYEKSY